MRVLLFIILFIPTISNGQYIVTEVPKFEFGILGGFNITKIQGSSDMQFSRRKIGPSTGIGLIYNLSRSFGINYELLYERRGWNDFSNKFGPTDTVRYESKLSASYLSIPILAKFQVGEARYLTFETGIQSSFRVSKLIWDEEDGLSGDVSDKMRSFDFGFVFGFGTKLPIKEKGNVYLKIRQHFGVTKMNEFSTSDSKSVMNNSYQFLIGYTHYLK